MIREYFNGGVFIAIYLMVVLGTLALLFIGIKEKDFYAGISGFVFLLIIIFLIGEYLVSVCI